MFTEKTTIQTYLIPNIYKLDKIFDEIHLISKRHRHQYHELSLIIEEYKKFRAETGIPIETLKSVINHIVFVIKKLVKRFYLYKQTIFDSSIETIEKLIDNEIPVLADFLFLSANCASIEAGNLEITRETRLKFGIMWLREYIYEFIDSLNIWKESYNKTLTLVTRIHDSLLSINLKQININEIRQKLQQTISDYKIIDDTFRNEFHGINNAYIRNNISWCYKKTIGSILSPSPIHNLLKLCDEIMEEAKQQTAEKPPSPVKEETSSPVKEETSSPVKEETSSPIKILSLEYVKEHYIYYIKNALQVVSDTTTKLSNDGQKLYIEEAEEFHSYGQSLLESINNNSQPYQSYQSVHLNFMTYLSKTLKCLFSDQFIIKKDAEIRRNIHTFLSSSINIQGLMYFSEYYSLLQSRPDLTDSSVFYIQFKINFVRAFIKYLITLLDIGVLFYDMKSKLGLLCDKLYEIVIVPTNITQNVLSKIINLFENILINHDFLMAKMASYISDHNYAMLSHCGHKIYRDYIQFCNDGVLLYILDKRQTTHIITYCQEYIDKLSNPKSAANILSEEKPPIQEVPTPESPINIKQIYENSKDIKSCIKILQLFKHTSKDVINQLIELGINDGSLDKNTVEFVKLCYEL
jgi:hypothetical protein